MLRAIGPLELILILVIVVIIFGVGRLGEVGGAVGKAIREFRKNASGDDEAKKDEAKPAEAQSAEAKKT